MNTEAYEEIDKKTGKPVLITPSLEGSPKKDPRPRAAAEQLLQVYNAGFKKNDGGDVPYYTDPAYLKQVYPVIKKFGLENRIELLPVYFSNENYRQSNWAIWTFLSWKVLNRLKHE